MVYQFSENFIEVFSHDEVVHGKAPMIYKMSGNLISDKAHSLRALYTLMWVWPGKNTLFMGNEFGQSSEWSHDSSLDWNLLQYRDHKGILKIIEHLNEFYLFDRDTPRLRQLFGGVRVGEFSTTRRIPSSVSYGRGRKGGRLFS